MTKEDDFIRKVIIDIWEGKQPLFDQLKRIACYSRDTALREVTKIANERTYCDVSGDCIHKDRIHNKTTIHDDLKRLRGKE